MRVKVRVKPATDNSLAVEKQVATKKIAQHETCVQVYSRRCAATYRTKSSTMRFERFPVGNIDPLDRFLTFLNSPRIRSEKAVQANRL